MTATLSALGHEHQNQPLLFFILHRYMLLLVLLVLVYFSITLSHGPDIPGLGRTAALQSIRHDLGTKKQCVDGTSVITCIASGKVSA